VLDLVRYVWEEFYRISFSLLGLDRPNSLTVSEDDTLTPGPTVVWQRLFDNGVPPSWANPSNVYDPATGVYTIPQDGVWVTDVAVRIPAFAAPGNRLYYGAIRTTITDPDGVPTEFFFYDGGDDSIPLSVSGHLMGPSLQGTTIFHDAAVVHPTVIDPQTVETAQYVYRISGIGNPTTR
jgi:hypothetical protein